VDRGWGDAEMPLKVSLGTPLMPAFVTGQKPITRLIRFRTSPEIWKIICRVTECRRPLRIAGGGKGWRRGMAMSQIGEITTLVGLSPPD
jgi:hypothetical protein